MHIAEPAVVEQIASEAGLDGAALIAQASQVRMQSAVAKSDGSSDC